MLMDGSKDACNVTPTASQIQPHSLAVKSAAIRLVPLTVTDDNGNGSTCNLATVTVEDNVEPDRVVSGLSRFSWMLAGNATITASDVDATAATMPAECVNFAISADPNDAFTCRDSRREYGYA